MRLRFWKKAKPPQEVAPAPAPEPAPEQAPQANIGRGRKILVVDDNLIVLKGFEFKLKAAGFEVLTATDGSEAVKLARENRPVLVLLDINFPPETGGMHWDGFVILQWLQRLEETEKIPIVVISSADVATVKPKVLAAGAADFFPKPVNFPELTARIIEILDS